MPFARNDRVEEGDGGIVVGSTSTMSRPRSRKFQIQLRINCMIEKCTITFHTQSAPKLDTGRGFSFLCLHNSSADYYYYSNYNVARDATTDNVLRIIKSREERGTIFPLLLVLGWRSMTGKASVVSEIPRSPYHPLSLWLVDLYDHKYSYWNDNDEYVQ